MVSSIGVFRSQLCSQYRSRWSDRSRRRDSSSCATIDERPAPPPLGLPGKRLAKNFDATTTRSRRPGAAASQSPRIFSE